MTADIDLRGARPITFLWKRLTRHAAGCCALMLGAATIAVLSAASVFAGELGLNVFGASVHVDRSANYNETNPGLGLHYVFRQPAPKWEIFGDAGAYYDSKRHWAKYVASGFYYRVAGSWKAGVSVACALSDSYNNGKPFFAPLPAIAYELRRMTINAAVLPSEEESLYVAGIAVFATIPLERARR